MDPSLCRGVCLSITHTSFKHTCNPIWQNHRNLLPVPSIHWGWSLPFHQWFSSWDGGYFRSRGIYFYLDSFTMFFIFFYGPLDMVYEFLWNYFVPDDFVNDLDFFVKVYGHIVWSHVPSSILSLLSTFWFLALEKQFGSICPITINEVTYRLVAHTLVI